MKILFVYPKFIKYLESFPGYTYDGRELIPGYSYPPALGISALMSVTDEKHEFVLLDENIEAIDYETDADLVAVSFFTPQASFAYNICTEFRSRGKLVVIGGVHPTVHQEEAQKYADIVCIGEAEQSWVQLLIDIENNCWKKVYRQSQATDLNGMPTPHRTAYYANTDRYGILIDYLELSRGCDAACESCVVPEVSGRELRFKSVDNILRDIHTLEYPMSFITDDIVFMQKDREIRRSLIDIFTEIGNSGYGRNHGFYISSNAICPPDPELLSAMRHAGASVSYFTFGFDPLSNLVMTGGPHRFIQKVIDQVKQLQDAGLLFYAAFHLGLDDHTVAIKDNILEFCTAAKIKVAQFCLDMPWPGTPLWKRYRQEGRIIHTDWKKYNGSHVVFKPKRMSVDQLQQTIADLWDGFSYNFHKLYQLQRTGVVDFDSIR
jgi:hypothetical protein